MAYITHTYVDENGDFDSWDEYVPDDDPNAGQTVYAEDPNVGGNLPYTAVGLSDGSVIYKDPVDNKYYDINGTPVDSTGTALKDTAGTTYKPDTNISSTIKNLLATNPLAKLATTAAAYKALTGGDKVQTAGWQGTVPMDRQMIRSQVQYDDTNRRPGEAGRQYLTNPTYVPSSAAGTAQTAADKEAQGIATAYRPRVPAPQQASIQQPMETLPPSGVASLMPVPKATGMARGGVARYLQGATDGMADKIPSSIDGKQKAALSHGEFVIPADVVSHLGNGNSDAGANKLYDMMARIRKARTGTTQQGKRINPDKFMPGGQVGYASGGIARFDGTTGSSVPNSAGTTGTNPASTTIPNLGTTTEGGLSSWAGPYVSDYLSKGAALSNAPYQAYTGPLTAGASNLQQQQFGGLSNLANNSTFNATQAQNYMNPYISAALNPQLEELRRQSQITQLGNASKATQAGAFGGSRQALMDTETQRGLLSEQNKAIGSGYANAFDKATGQFNADQARQLQIQQALGTAGATQRDIEQQGITADKTQFEEQRDAPYKLVQFQKDLLQGLPITTSANTTNQTQLSQLSGQVQGLMALYQSLANLGQSPKP
jgi:hypothetical protein